MVGKYNGKNLYRKCYTYDSTALTASYIVDSTVNSNDMTPVKMDGVFYRSTHSYWFCGSNIVSSSTYFELGFQPQGVMLHISNYSISKFNMQVYYTKNNE